MGKNSSKETDDEIGSLWYQGLPREEIRDNIRGQIGDSAGHIADVTAKENDLIGKPNVEFMRSLAKDARKENVTIVAIAHYVRLKKECKKYNLNEKDLFEALPQIAAACKKTNKSIQELPVEIEQKAAKLEALELKAKHAEKAAQAADKRCVEAEKHEQYSKEERDKFHKAMNWLEERGLSFDDPLKLANMLANGERDNYDPKILYDKASRVRMMDAEIMRLEGTLRQLTLQKKEQEKTIVEQQLRIQINSERLRLADELDAMNFTVLVLQSISDTVKKVAAANNMSHEAGVEKFKHDILTKYDALVGLDSIISRMQEEKEGLEVHLRALEIAYAKENKAVASLKLLHEHGVPDTEIVLIHFLAEGENWNLQDLSSKVSRYGSINMVLDQVENQVKELEKRILVLKHEVSTLETQKASLQEFLSKEGSIKARVKSITNALQECSQQIREEADDYIIRIRQVKQAAFQDIHAIGNEAAVVTKQYAQAQGLLSLAPLIHFSRGEPVDPSQVRESGLFAMNILLSSIPSNSESRCALEIAIKVIQGDLLFEV